MNTSPLYPSMIDEQIAEIAGKDPAEVIQLAERLGFVGWPVKSYRDPQGLWIHRYAKAQQPSQ